MELADDTHMEWEDHTVLAIKLRLLVESNKEIESSSPKKNRYYT